MYQIIQFSTDMTPKVSLVTHPNGGTALCFREQDEATNYVHDNIERRCSVGTQWMVVKVCSLYAVGTRVSNIPIKEA